MYSKYSSQGTHLRFNRKKSGAILESHKQNVVVEGREAVLVGYKNKNKLVFIRTGNISIFKRKFQKTQTNRP